MRLGPCDVACQARSFLSEFGALVVNTRRPAPGFQMLGDGPAGCQEHGLCGGFLPSLQGP